MKPESCFVLFLQQRLCLLWGFPHTKVTQDGEEAAEWRGSLPTNVEREGVTLPNGFFAVGLQHGSTWDFFAINLNLLQAYYFMAMVLL